MFSSSGIKRGLAATAISALAVTGLPFMAGTAYADSVNDQVGNGNVELFTQYSGFASTQNDGVNNTVHLLAGGGDNVSRVRFEYDNAAGATTEIATVSRTNGVFTNEWAPPSGLLGQTVTVRAVGLSSVDTPVAGASDENVVTVSADASAVDIANAAGSALGVFQQPYGVEPEETGLPGDGVDHSTRQGIITGTTSGTGAITLSDRSAGSPTRPAVTPSNGAFRGTVDFQDYDLSGTPDEAIVGAQQSGGSDDAEVVNLESQRIAGVEAVASPARIPNDGATTSTGVITVTDAAGRPLAGAQVIFDENNNDVWDGANNGGTEESRYTDANGQARFTGLEGSAAGRSYTFFVNTTAGDDYEPAVDFRRQITVTSVNQVATTVTTTSADGDAFDVDENDADDLQARVVDQNGDPIPNQAVNYTLSVTRFDGTTTAPTSTTGSATTGADGRADIPFTDLGDGTYTLRAYVERNGTPGQQDGDLSAANRTFKAGDADLEFADAPTAVSSAGTTDTFEASLTLDDGTPLAGRAVRFTYTATGNVVVAAQANQPSGTTRNSDTQATGTTNAQGVTSVALSDPASPDQAELDGQLDAETIANSIGDADADAAPLEVDFVDDTPPARSTVTVSPLAEGKPGEATDGTVTVVTDGDNNPATPATPVNGVAVTLTAGGEAFFTDGSPASGSAAGGDVRLRNLGKTLTVVTDANGQADFQTTIERDSGFDDDGATSAVITATSGTFTDSETQTFDSSDPINGGEVSLTVSPESEQDNAIDPTRTGDRVYYDVTTTDQFGNVVGGEIVQLETSGGSANEVVAVDENGDPDDDIQDPSTDEEDVESDSDNEGDFYLTSSQEGTVTVTGSWTTPTFRYITVGNTLVPTAGSETLTDSASQEFYEVDLEEATITLTSSEEHGEAEVGTAITETVTVLDQEGRPVQDASVEFIRTGAGSQDGDPNRVTVTDRNGKAAYTFTGTEPGEVRISAVVAEQEGGAPVATLEDTIVITGEDEPEQITARLTGQNNGARADRLTVRTSPTGAASNALARLYTRINGRRVQLGQKRLTEGGAATFTTRDRNGRNFTSYWVQVSRTDSSTAARSNNKRVR